MVSQDLVERVMRVLNKPCSPKDIENYIREHELIKNVPSEMSCDISGVLNILRRWYIVDKFPDFHGLNSKKWYLKDGGHPHDSTKCYYCKGIKTAHTRNTYKHILQSNSRKLRRITDEDHFAANDFEIITREW